MSSLHLGTGSKQPPKVGGKLRLYSMEYCPFAQRARLVLLAKNIAHDIVNINLYDKPKWFLEIYPKGQVPVLDTGSETIVESLKVCEYLEENYLNNPLYSKDEKLREKEKQLIAKMDSLTDLFYGCLLKFSTKTPEEWAQAFTPILKEFQVELTARGTTFFGGEKPGMVDYMIWPWSERAGLLLLVSGKKLPFTEDLTLMKQWKNAMKENEACKATFTELEKHKKIYENRMKNVHTDFNEV